MVVVTIHQEIVGFHIEGHSDMGACFPLGVSGSDASYEVQVVFKDYESPSVTIYPGFFFQFKGVMK